MVSPLVTPEGDSGADAAGLVLVSTPIGNLGDMTLRGIETLRGADLILCEDTRMTARLLTHYGIGAPAAALHEHNEDARTPEILGRLRRGERIALVSDAGTPLVSDPGYRLVRAAIAAGLRVSAVPGANAAVMALILSGLPPCPFLFAGFPPPKAAARRAAFGRLREAEQAGLRATLIFYEAPHRLAECLADLHAVFGDRAGAVARELSKRFEEVARGRLGELASRYAAEAARGEICVLVGPAEDDAAPEYEALLRAALATMSVKAAVEAVAAAVGAPRKTVYKRALELRRDGDAGNEGS
jgi:16S rRNA (cytidine1402-2'-O)-methyltransferase